MTGWIICYCVVAWIIGIVGHRLYDDPPFCAAECVIVGMIILLFPIVIPVVLVFGLPMFLIGWLVNVGR
jgi:hypothetical protein